MNIRQFLQRRFVGSSVALAAGASLTLSFSPFGWWPVAILSPALLMWLWDGANPRRAAVLGFWFNFGTFAVGTYWLYISLRLVGGAPIPLALMLMLGLAAIMGCYHALLGWAVAKYLPPRGALRWLVAMPAAWLLVEWWRSWFLTGFGWLALGYAHTDNWLGALAPVVGQYGLGYLTLLMAGALVTLALGTARERVVGRRVVRRDLDRGIPVPRHRVDRSRTGVPSKWRWCRAPCRRMKSGSASNLASIVELYRTPHPRGARRRHHLLAGIGRARPG